MSVAVASPGRVLSLGTKLFLKGLHLCFVPRGIIRPPSPLVWLRLYANPRNYRFLLECDTICRSASFSSSFSFVRVIYREARREKRRKGSRHEEKTVCVLSRTIPAHTSGLSRPLSLSLFLSFFLFLSLTVYLPLFSVTRISRTPPQFSPHFCADRTVLRHQGSIVLVTYGGSPNALFSPA